MELFEHEGSQKMSREEAADVLRRIADDLSRHNQLEYTRGDIRYRVDVGDQVELELELEVTDSGGELEIQIEW